MISNKTLTYTKFLIWQAKLRNSLRLLLEANIQTVRHKKQSNYSANSAYQSLENTLQQIVQSPNYSGQSPKGH